jgi:hypothetical protein
MSRNERLLAKNRPKDLHTSKYILKRDNKKEKQELKRDVKALLLNQKSSKAPIP